MDVATGNEKAGKGCGYQTKGPGDAWGWRNVLPKSPEPICSTWYADITCSDEQYAALEDGSAVVEHDLVVSPAGAVFN